MTNNLRTAYLAQALADLQTTAAMMSDHELADRLGAVVARMESETSIDPARPHPGLDRAGTLAEVARLIAYADSDPLTVRYASWIRGAVPELDADGPRVDLGDDPTRYAEPPATSLRVSVATVAGVPVELASVALGLAVGAQPDVELRSVSSGVEHGGRSVFALRHTGGLQTGTVDVGDRPVEVRFVRCDLPTDVDLDRIVADHLAAG